MKSKYTYLSKDGDIAISFLLKQSQCEEIDDSISIDFMSKLLKMSEDEVNDSFYLDDVLEVKE